MLAGILRFKQKAPKSFFRLLTMYSHRYGVNLIYFTPEDINIRKKRIQGQMLINDQLVNVNSRIPDFIDVTPHIFNEKNRRKYTKEIEFLKKNSELSIDRRQIIRKDKLQKVLSESKEFSYLAIPTMKVKDFKGFLDKINQNKKMVIKSVSGLQGKGVTLVSMQDTNFIVGEKKQERVLSQNQLEDFFNSNIYGKNYIMQKYINSRSNNGEPIDCRIHLEKNKYGKWEVARKFIRIGIGQKVVSNISQGGCISDVKNYLKSTFGDNWKKVYNKITEIEKRLPYFIEKHEKKQFMVMGFDVGIDLNGEVCIFEVNSFPIIAPQRAQVSKIRAGYYAYRIKKIKENKKSKNNTEKKQVKDNYYKREYDKMVNSTSWKITKPVRMIGSIIKRKREKNVTKVK